MSSCVYYILYSSDGQWQTTPDKRFYSRAHHILLTIHAVIVRKGDAIREIIHTVRISMTLCSAMYTYCAFACKFLGVYRWPFFFEFLRGSMASWTIFRHKICRLLYLRTFVSRIIYFVFFFYNQVNQARLIYFEDCTCFLRYL